MPKMTVGGVVIDISDDDYRRFERAVQGNPIFRRLADGRIVNINHIKLVEGNVAKPVKPAEPEPPKVEKISSDKLRALIDKSGLSMRQFAESVGYSPATIIMALKKGVISEPLSDAVMEKYGE